MIVAGSFYANFGPKLERWGYEIGQLHSLRGGPGWINNRWHQRRFRASSRNRRYRWYRRYLHVGAGTLDEGQFAFSAFIDYLRLKQLSEPTLLANVGNDVHGLQTVESYAVALAYGITND